MMYGVVALLRFLTLFFALSLVLPAPDAIAADDRKVWSFSDGDDPDNPGLRTVNLSYGVPETDNTQVTGICKTRPGSNTTFVRLVFGADIGTLKEGADVKLRFSGGGFNKLSSGSVYGTKLEEGVAGVRLDIDADDLLLLALTERNELDYLVPGYTASKLNLRDGHGTIKRFMVACRSQASSPAPQRIAEIRIKSGGRGTTAAISAKEAFEAAKELGTIEAWEAFLNNYPSGFHADLARAYVRRLGNKAPKTAAPVTAPVVKQVPSQTLSEPDIAISQTANQAGCAGGAPCSYSIVATNLGGKPFSGQIVIARMENGIRLYSFRYLWEGTLRVGVMAQDLLKDPAMRGAVIPGPSGYYAVDYPMLGLKMVTLEEWNRQGVAAVLLRPATRASGSIRQESTWRP